MKYKFKTKPYQHQLKALELSWKKSYFAYFMEMGTGKSKVLLDNMAMLYDQGKIDGALIVAPKGVIGTWYNDSDYSYNTTRNDVHNGSAGSLVKRFRHVNLGNLAFYR